MATTDATFSTPSPSSSATTASVPHRVAGWAPAGGATCLPTVLRIPPTKPSGVQLASAIRPPGRVDADELPGSLGVVGAEHHADRGQHDVERLVAVRQGLGVGLGELDDEVLGHGPAAGDLEQLRHVVDAGRDRGPTGSGEGDVAGAGRDVEDVLAGCDAGVLDEVLGHRHGQRGDLVVVAAAPDLLLLVAELGVVGGGGDGHGGAFRWSASREGRGCAGVGCGDRRGDVLVPESGMAHRLGDQVGRVGLDEQEARVVLGDEDRPDAPHQPTRAGQLGSGELRASGVLPRGVVVALCDVELDEVLSHASTVGPGRGSPKLRRTRGSRLSRPQDDPRTTPGNDPRSRPQEGATPGRRARPRAGRGSGCRAWRRCCAGGTRRCSP